MHDSAAPAVPVAEYSTTTVRSNTIAPASRATAGLHAGVLLVVLGAVLLAIQFAPAASIATLWPLLVIAVGVVQLVTPHHLYGWGIERVADGIGTIVVGSVFLGCTLGFVAWSMWLTLLGLWPVLLIAGGLKLVGRGVGQSWISALAPVLIWAALLYSAGTAWTGAYGYRPLPTYGIHSPVIIDISGL